MRMWVMCWSLQYSLKASLVNCGPLSDTIVDMLPSRAQESLMRVIVSGAVVLPMMATSGHLE